MGSDYVDAFGFLFDVNSETSDTLQVHCIPGRAAETNHCMSGQYRM